MTTDSGSPQSRTHVREAVILPEQTLFKRLTIVFGLLSAATAAIGLITAGLGLSLTGSNTKMIAFSAAVIWIVIGVMLAYQTVKPLHRIAGLVMQAAFFLIAVGAAIEFFFNVSGSHFFIETLFVNAGTAFLGSSSTPISPVAAALAVLAALGLGLLIRQSGLTEEIKRGPEIVSILGWAISLVSFTFVMSYAYGNPLLYGTPYIPIAFTSALAALFTGGALISAAGPGAVPVRYMIGSSTRASLLREFVPLVVGIALFENIVFVSLSSWFNVHDTVLLSAILVIFVMATVAVVSRVSGKIGGALERAEEELVRKNEDLGAMNEELTATQEELRQTNDDLVVHERRLIEKNNELNALNEELTATHEELRQNIDELTNAEKTLRESQKENTFLADLLNRSEQPFGVGYPDGRLGIINGSFERLTGYSADELRRIDWSSVLTPQEWREPERERLEELHLTGVPVRYEKEYIRKDGSRVPIELLVQLITDSNGKPLHYFSFITDITERKQAKENLEKKNADLNALNEELASTEEELRSHLDELARKEGELRESEQRFRTITEISPVQFSIARRSDGGIVFTNPAYDRAFGFAPGELIGKKTPDLYYDPADREGMLKIFKETGLVENHEIRVKKKDGTPFWVNVSLRAIRFLDNDSLLASSIDITGRKEAENELKRKNEDLNAAYEEIAATEEELHQNLDELTQREHALQKALVEKEVLLSEIHHRVKNNLTAFISLLSLEGSTEDSPAGKLLKQDLQNRARSMALVHETLYRTNMYDEVDMGLYLTTLTDQIANSFMTTKQVKTVVHAQGVMLDIPRATPAGLIINELITNSFKYAFPDSFDPCQEKNSQPTITIALSKEDGVYKLTFRDNGVGLPPGFDISTTKSLGLKLVNFLAKHQLRAKTEVTSACGTEFVFRFKE